MGPQPDDIGRVDEIFNLADDSTYDFLDDNSIDSTDERGQHVINDCVGPPTQSNTSVSQFPSQKQDKSYQERVFFRSYVGEHGKHWKDIAEGSPNLEQGHRSHILQQPTIIAQPFATDYSGEKSGLEELNNLLTPARRGKEYVTESRQGPRCIFLRQMVSPGGLMLKSMCYKILYVGDQVIKDSIVQKLATALSVSSSTATCESSRNQNARFSIIPISSIAGQSDPEVVLIDSSGVELEVEDCKHTSGSAGAGKANTLLMTLGHGKTVQSICRGPSYQLVGDWKLPDLAVFAISETVGTESNKQFKLAHEFLERHGIRILQVANSQHNDFANPLNLNVDPILVHRCVVDERSPSSKPSIVKRLPVDLETFLNIDSNQMNRNLAAVTKAAQPSEHSNQNMHSKKPTAIDRTSSKKFEEGRHSNAFSMVISPSYKKLSGNKQRLRTLIWALLLFIIVVALIPKVGLLAPRTSGRASSSQHEARSLGASDFNTWPRGGDDRVTISSLIKPSGFASTIDRTAALRGVPKDFTWETDIANLMRDCPSTRPNETFKSKVHILGSQHILIMLSQWLVKSRKHLKISFDITRGNRTVPNHQLRLFEGVYALRIPDHEAHGLLFVTLAAKGRLAPEENFEVNFGPAWLKRAAWRRRIQKSSQAIAHDVARKQAILQVYFERSADELLWAVRSLLHSGFCHGKRVESRLSILFTKTLGEAGLKLVRLDQITQMFNTSSVPSLRSYKDAGLGWNNLKGTRWLQGCMNWCLQESRYVTSISLLENFVHSERWPAWLDLRPAQKVALRYWWMAKGPPAEDQGKARNRKVGKENLRKANIDH